MFTATYSPDDNKLRLYAGGRLSPDLYARVKAAGFKWAPKQDLFVAPTWSPGREDLLIELAGEIGDEDSSLVDRAEERAERFEDYSDKRAAESLQAQEAVARIADNIPLGQPILVGHHSEKHARKDAEKIQNGMRRTVKLFEESQYWKERAAAAIGHAKYKERPDVRARRIKTIEADKRKVERAAAESAMFARIWESLEVDSRWTRKDGTEVTLQERALFIANRDHISKEFTLAEFPRDPPASQYEGMMSLWSALSGGIVTALQAQEIALRVHAAPIARRKRWIEHYENRIVYEKAMLQEAGGTVADRTGPEVGGACKAWCSRHGEWSLIQKVNKVSVTLLDNWGNGGQDFRRTIPFDKLTALMSKADVDAARDAGRLVGEDKRGFALLDSPPPVRTYEREEVPAEIAAMKESLKVGVQVVTAPQLFATPSALAARMVEMLELCDGDRILEPSAGTGQLLAAMRETANRVEGGISATAVEVNGPLCADLRRRFVMAAPYQVEVVNRDFLECNGDIGTFDRVIMNPPFVNGADIQHIKHAWGMLRPGGRLVALCANGPRQRDALQPIATHWEDLPAGTFKDQGTGVNVALVVLESVTP